MRNWIHLDQEMTQAPEDIQGFVYKITNETSGRMYIGKKSFIKRIKRKPLKGKKRVRIDYVQSDWKKYMGSCDELLEDIKKQGSDEFKREILYLCRTKKDMTYIEAREQFVCRAIESEDYYNTNILGTFYSL